MKKLFLVLLDPAFIEATAWIRPHDGQLGPTPYWICSQVDTSSPHYLIAVPTRTAQTSMRPYAHPSPACIHIPHHRVLGIVETTPDAAPFGFGKGG